MRASKAKSRARILFYRQRAFPSGRRCLPSWRFTRFCTRRKCEPVSFPGLPRQPDVQYLGQPRVEPSRRTPISRFHHRRCVAAKRPRGGALGRSASGRIPRCRAAGRLRHRESCRAFRSYSSSLSVCRLLACIVPIRRSSAKSLCRRVPIFRRPQSAPILHRRGMVSENILVFRRIHHRRRVSADWRSPCCRANSGNVVTAMKIEIPMLTVLLLAANDLLARATVQGFEQTAFTVLVEWSGRLARAAKLFVFLGRELNKGRPV